MRQVDSSLCLSRLHLRAVLPTGPPVWLKPLRAQLVQGAPHGVSRDALEWAGAPDSQRPPISAGCWAARGGRACRQDILGGRRFSPE